MTDAEDASHDPKFGFLYVTVVPEDSTFVIGWFFGDEPTEIDASTEPAVLVRRLVDECPFDLCFVVYSLEVGSHMHRDAQEIVRCGTSIEDIQRLRLSRRGQIQATALFKDVGAYMAKGRTHALDVEDLQVALDDRTRRLFARRRWKLFWMCVSALVTVATVTFAGYILGAVADGAVGRAEYWLAGPLVAMLFRATVQHLRVVWKYFEQHRFLPRSAMRSQVGAEPRVNWSDDESPVRANI